MLVSFVKPCGLATHSTLESAWPSVEAAWLIRGAMTCFVTTYWF